MKNSSLFLLFIIVVSCKTVVVNKQRQKIAATALELATIGEKNPNLQINNFETTAIPQLEYKIRVVANIVSFNKTTYKAYTKAAKLQGKKTNIVYVDSLADKPTYILLKIADKVTVLNALNSPDNVTIFKYLKTVPKANIITAISVAFDPQQLVEIKQAEELYLSNTKYKKYDLELYKNKKLYKSIEFTKGTTFTFKLASFCWGENNRHQPVLVNIIDENSKCINNTFSSYNQVKRKENKVKF